MKRNSSELANEISVLHSTAIALIPLMSRLCKILMPDETSTYLGFAEHTEPEALLSSSHTPFV